MYWYCQIDSEKHDFEIITKLRRLIYSTRIQVETKGGTENGPRSFLYTVLYEKDKCYFLILIFISNFLCFFFVACLPLFSKSSLWNSNFKTDAEFNFRFTLSRVQSVSFESIFGRIWVLFLIKNTLYSSAFESGTLRKSHTLLFNFIKHFVWSTLH